MRPVIAIVFLLGVAGLILGYWGIYTPQGRSQFDEMDGIYPMLAAAAGCIALFIAAVLAVVGRIKSAKRPVQQP